ncbi:hypothetical protein BJY24_000125 [Nocardia transvalensis]|uniref:Uncharacterized protein n=1 Tax=Nocardia transvalensis TaxID=37333 RepID=A0A7W9P8R5_9NOCA|nr:hypothetical protein [Nocardia transvalensis]MBB5911258.1 hypothetical protein [Nocardia transvalensis]
MRDTAEQAFEALIWRSQQTNTYLRATAAQVPSAELAERRTTQTGAVFRHLAAQLTSSSAAVIGSRKRMLTTGNLSKVTPK